MDRHSLKRSAGRRLLGLSIVAWGLAGVVADAQTTGGLIGHGGQRWQTDYGVRAGRCDRDAILVQSAGQRDLVAEHQQHLKNRTVGIIGGGQSGVLLSTRGAGRHGARFDAADRACLGHVLELGTPGRDVSWVNTGTQRAYVVALEAGTVESPAGGSRCRVVLLASVPARGWAGTGGASRALNNAERLIACQSSPGVWAFR
mgnify:CR=1 FL=1|jgi:hypothetical protein